MHIDWHRIRRRHRLVDSALALVMFGCAIAGSAMPHGPTTDPDLPSPYVFLVAATACTALLWHRSRPRTVVVVTIVCAMALGVRGYISPGAMCSAMAAVYSLAVRTDRRTTGTYSLTAVVLLVTTSAVYGPGDPWQPETVGVIAWSLLPGAVGDSVRMRRAHMAAVVARAELAERTREEEARHRVGEERMRIARELHDVVAHHMALANAQAGAAAYLVRRQPEQAHEILDNLADTTAAALRELKATVGLLRRIGEPEAPLAPAPGLARLPELVSALTRADLTVEVLVEGTPQTLSSGVDLTAYRIVQEALTNVAKHAGTASATVRLTYARHWLTIAVDDDGRRRHDRAGNPTGTGGFGLIGMRERALSVGGRLSAGRRADGGFEVTAQLPIRTLIPRFDKDET